MATFCPVTGTRVYTDPEWINQHVSDSFTANFWVINGSIIYSLPKGRAHIEGVRNSLKLNREVAAFVSKSAGRYVQIEDYSFLSGSSAAARRYFVKDMDSRKHLSSLIFCNVSPALFIAVNIGKRFNTTGKHIHVVKHYSDAVRLALEHVDEDLKSEVAPIDLSRCFGNMTRFLSPVDLLFGDAWNIRTPEYSNDAVVINQSILHSTPSGYLEAKHVPLIEGFRYACMSAMEEGTSVEYVVVDNSKLQGGSRGARTEYMKSLVNWHQRFPLKMFIGYGNNTFMKTALHLARPVMPFKVRIAKDIEHAFQLVRDNQAVESATQQAASQPAKPFAVQQNDIDKIMAFIASINWESQGIDKEIEIDSDHPLFFLYQSIRLIKEELDELFSDREWFESELHQARKMESVGTLAAGIAHDFNNILYMITGNTALALDEIPQGSPVRSYLEAIKSASSRAERVVKQLLNYSREGDQALGPIDAVAVIGDALGLLRATIPATIEIRADLPDSGITISSDATQINQVLMNLFANAAQAMEETGGFLDISVRKATITEPVSGISPDQKAGEYLRITVSDSGPGIEAENVERIFDPYFTTKEVGKGSGMGLAVVLGIVKNHGGTITVDSHPGLGTTFTLLFPVIDELPASVAQQRDESPVGSESILFVEDEEDIVKMMQKMLRGLGYILEARVKPTDALKLFQSKPDSFDLVITDMTMPQMTGVELAERVKDVRPDIPIIICTGYSSLIDERKAKELGISALATKPFEMQEMAQTIRNVLDQSKGGSIRRPRPHPPHSEIGKAE